MQMKHQFCSVTLICEHKEDKLHEYYNNKL